jgi:hypothetical protein
MSHPQNPQIRRRGEIYSPLDTAAQEIRILILSSGSGDQRVSCDLQVASLNKSSKYTALSSAWDHCSRFTFRGHPELLHRAEESPQPLLPCSNMGGRDLHQSRGFEGEKAASSNNGYYLQQSCPHMDIVRESSQNSDLGMNLVHSIRVEIFLGLRLSKMRSHRRSFFILLDVNSGLDCG